MNIVYLKSNLIRITFSVVLVLALTGCTLEVPKQVVFVNANTSAEKVAQDGMSPDTAYATDLPPMVTP